MFRKIVAHIATISAGREMNRFFQATSHLRAVQNDLLRRQMNIVAGSEFAKTYDLAGVETYQDFCRKLPILSYSDYRPYIEKLKNGDSHALFNPSEKMVMFALTSGTTAEPKYIPVTKRFVDDYRRGWNIFGLKALLDHPQALMRKIIQITSSGQEIQTPCGLWAGAITGLLASTQKWIVRKHYTTPLSVAKIKDPTAKMYTVARLAITEDVAFMNTANPSTTLRLGQTMEQYGEELIRDVRDGELRAPGDVPAEVHDDLRRTGRLGANRKAAAKLSAIFHNEGKLLPRNVWRMGFINNWTGGTLKLYLQRFGDYFGDTPVRDLGLLASEGRFSVPIDDHTPAGILEITSNFFEFIPESQYGQANPTVLLPEQVTVGEKYFLLFSNATGLCRYNIGDLVRVVDFYNQTPMIEFLNKGAHTSSVTGEKITERQVVEAIEIVGRQMGSRIECFQIQPQWADPPYYMLTVEESIATGKGRELGQRFDEILSTLNIEYEAKRSSGRLGGVQVRWVADDYFRRDDLQRLSSCGRSEQYKRKFLIPEIENSPEA